MPSSAFQWEKLLSVAEELGKHKEEEYLRAAIGRAYYYVFHLARQRLINNRFVILEGTNSRRQVWEKFEASPDAQCQVLAKLAKTMKEKRERADYNSQPYARIGEDVPVVLATAKEFAEKLAALRSDLPRNAGVRAN